MSDRSGKPLLGHSEPVLIPGDEGLTDKPLYSYRITMGDHVFRVKASEYEHAAVWLGAWCNTHGIERRGAEFLREMADA